MDSEIRRQDDERALKAHDDWRAWGQQFGWRLRSSTYERVADFVLPDDSLFEVTKVARNGIDSALSEVNT